MAAHLPTTELLLRVRTGDRDAADLLYAQLYESLRQIAHQRLARFRRSDTLGTTVLVHEAYIRLNAGSAVEWHDRSHFLALASRAMRCILVDYARERGAQKRGGGQRALALDAVEIAAGQRADELLALDEALTELAARDERLSRIVELRFFGGLTFDEVAEVTGLSVPTAKRDWARARAWLFRTMQPDPTP